MFLGLFKSKKEKLVDKIEKKYKGINLSNEISKIQNSKTHSYRNADETTLLNYILLYGLYTENDPYSGSSTSSTCTSHSTSTSTSYENDTSHSTSHYTSSSYSYSSSDSSSSSSCDSGGY